MFMMKSYQLAKRSLDIVAASMLLVIFLPIWLIVPILIKLDSPGPVFYKHKRVGRFGKPFEMYKFRSMFENAHKYLHQQNPELLRKFKDNDWKLEHDPRITRLGRVLRSITVDEFPQILNVLKGDMSIVGPRAYMAEEVNEQVKKYPETKKNIQAIYSIKPGVTGPWQVSGRNELPFTKRTELDAQYALQKSLWTDILIILKTPKAMFSKW
jgi:lipopolysaccharide/colanic/teichoic acid biosynthesis glycosyltransferase